MRSIAPPEYREASAIVNQIFMIDLPNAENGLVVRALQRADHEADALLAGGADAGVAPASTNGRSCLASWSHICYGATDRELTPRQSLPLAGNRASSPVNVRAARRWPLWRSRVTRVFWIDEARVVRRRAEHMV